LELNVAPEPRLRPLFLKYAAADMTARTNLGTVLASQNPEARYDRTLGEGGRYWQILLDFQAPKGDQCAQVSLRGKFQVETAAGSEKIRFTNLSQAMSVARRRGGVTVTVLRASAEPTETARDVNVRIQVAYDAGGPAFESHRTWIFHNEVYLEHNSGRQ